jgi:hypothetical protein
MNKDLAVRFADAAMTDVLKRATAAPKEPEIAKSARNYTQEIRKGEWSDDIEVVVHLVGYFDCQLNWWKTMTEVQREYVAFYRAVKAAHKYPTPNKLTGVAKSPGFTNACEEVAEQREWAFSTVGTVRNKALQFGAAYEGDDPDFLKAASRIDGDSVKSRGVKGGRKSRT